MASLLSWLGNEAKRVKNTIGNDIVAPVERVVNQTSQLLPGHKAPTPQPRQVNNQPQTISQPRPTSIQPAILPPVRVAPATPPINVGGKPVFAPPSRVTPATPPHASNLDKLEGAASGIIHAATDVAQVAPLAVGQLKAITPHPLDKFIDTARKATQTTVNAPQNAIDNLQQNKGFLTVDKKPVTQGGRDFQLAGEALINAPQIVQAAAEVPTIVRTGVKLAKDAPQAAKDVKDLVVGIKNPHPDLSNEDIAALSRVQNSLEGGPQPNIRPGDLQTYRSVLKQKGFQPNDTNAGGRILNQINSYDSKVQKRAQDLRAVKQRLAVNNETGAVGKDVRLKAAIPAPQPIKIKPNEIRPAPDAAQPPIRPPKAALTAPSGEMLPPSNKLPVAIPSPELKTTRYASQTVPKSEFVGEKISSEAKANAPQYEQASEQKRYTNALGGVQQQGLDNFTANVHERLNVPNGKINHQDVADAQTAAQLLEARGNAGDLQNAADLYDKVSGHLTAAGQTIQAAAVMARRSPAGLRYSALRDLNKAGVKITPELEAQIKEQTDAIGKLAPGPDKDLAVAVLQKTVAKHLPQSNIDKGLSIWKAGLLSGVKTQQGNAISNATFAGLKKISDIPSTVVDKGLSLVTRERTKSLTGRGSIKGTVEGLKNAKYTMKTGIDPRSIGDKYEQHAEVNFNNPILRNVLAKPTNFVFRGMNAADQPFWYAALKNSLYDQAKADGINKSLKGQSLLEHMDKTVASPTMKMAETAAKEANKSTLNYDTLASKAVQGMHKGIDNMSGVTPAGKAIAHTAVNILAPFVRVPSAFISRTVDFTPLGVPKEIFHQIAAKQFDQRSLSQAIGEGATGTGMIALGVALTQQGLISGDYPKNDPKEAQRWKAEGITPNSVKVGDKWVSMNYLGPVGLLFNAGHQLETAHGESATSKAGAAIGGLGQGLLGQSFLQGFSGFSDAINNPQQSAKSYINSEASSVVPAISNDISNATDKYQRQADTPAQSIKNRIPGLRETNPIKNDVYGNPLKQPAGALNTLNGLKPSNSLTGSNPVIAEVARLHNVNPQDSSLQVTPTPVGRTITVEKNNVTLNDTQRYTLQQKVGQATQKAWGQLIKTPEYKALDDTDKAKALSNLRSDASTLATRQFVIDSKLGTYTKAPSQKIQNLGDGSANIADYATSTTSTGAASSSETPAQKYKAALASYTQKQKSMSDVQKFSAQQSLAKLKVEAPYSNDVISLYGLSKAKLNNFLTTNNNGKALYSQLQAYDKDLLDAGLITTSKFKTGLSISTKASTATKSKDNSYLGNLKYQVAIKAPKMPKTAKPKAAKPFKQIAIKKFKPTKPLVARATKSKVVKAIA